MNEDAGFGTIRSTNMNMRNIIRLALFALTAAFLNAQPSYAFGKTFQTIGSMRTLP